MEEWKKGKGSGRKLFYRMKYLYYNMFLLDWNKWHYKILTAIFAKQLWKPGIQSGVSDLDVILLNFCP